MTRSGDSGESDFAAQPQRGLARTLGSSRILSDRIRGDPRGSERMRARWARTGHGLGTDWGRTGHGRQSCQGWKIAEMTKYPAAQTAVVGAYLGSKNARSLWDGLESHRSIGEVAPRFSRINFMGARGANSNPVCTYNIYREALGLGAAAPTAPHGGFSPTARSATLSFSHLCHCKGGRGGGQCTGIHGTGIPGRQPRGTGNPGGAELKFPLLRL